MNQGDLDRLSRDPRNWRLYFLYFCPGDPRIIVPKRLRTLGWTLNFAHLLAVPVFAVICASFLGILALARLCGLHGASLLGAEVLLGLALVALCYRLSHPRD
jgi:hypothetical protein